MDRLGVNLKSSESIPLFLDSVQVRKIKAMDIGMIIGYIRRITAMIYSLFDTPLSKLDRGQHGPIYSFLKQVPPPFKSGKSINVLSHHLGI